MLLNCNYCGLVTNRIKAHIRQMHRRQFQMAINIDNIVGQLTHDETKEMLRRCMENLSVPDVIGVISTQYDRDDRDEIVAFLEDM